MHLLWTGDVSDDETTGAYDHVTGLGSFISCDDEKHLLILQFSYSRNKPALPFYAEVFAKGSRAAAPSVFETLTPKRKVWSYRRSVPSCAKEYSIYVGYPDAAPR